MIVKIITIQGLQEAINYHNEIISYKNSDNSIFIDFRETTFLRNHYISIIGMAIEILKTNNIDTIIYVPMDKKVYKLLNDTGFLSKYIDTIHINKHNINMIKYTHIPLLNNDNEVAIFTSYFCNKLTSKMTNLSPRLLKLIMKKILELFSNVFRHSNSQLGLFCSGQFYPEDNKFYFTIVDNGVTIKSNVNKFKKEEFKKKQTLFSKALGYKFKPLSGIESIQWAVKDKNSTSNEGGGLGLNLLAELVTKSDGLLEIISNDGYFSLNKNLTMNLSFPEFNGTIINIGLDTDSDKYFDIKEGNNDKNQCKKYN